MKLPTVVWFVPICAGAAPLAHAQTVHRNLTGTTYTETGASASRIGDLDGDGLDEIIVGSPTAPRGGRVMVWSGANGFIREMTAHDTEDMGRSVDGGDPFCGSGDVNGDGKEDIVCGAPLSKATLTAPRTGAAVVFNGAGGATPIHKIYGENDGDDFGRQVAMLGDVDADGYADFIVGAPRANPPYVKVFSGASGAVLWRIAGVQSGEEFGWAVNGIGDLDGDGRDDFAVGAPRYAGAGGADCGRVAAYSGASGLPLFALEGTATGQRLGTSLASIGDLSGDGAGEVLVGGNGLVRIFDGGSGAVRGTLAEADTQFGASVCGVGDQNGDAIPDFLVGAPLADDLRTDAGHAHLYSGADHAVLYTFMGHLLYDNLGNDVEWGGYTNADPWPDFLIGVLGDQKTLLTTFQRPAISEPSPGRAGMFNSLTVSGVPPGSEVTLEYSYSTALRPLIHCQGLHFGVSSAPFSPITQLANANGKATFGGPVPPAFAQRLLYIQACFIQPNPDPPYTPCGVTERLEFTFQ